METGLSNKEKLENGRNQKHLCRWCQRETDAWGKHVANGLKRDRSPLGPDQKGSH